MNQLLLRIQGSLSPDLLKPAYRHQWTTANPLFGFCYIASESLWHLLGGPKSGYTPYVARDDNGGTHWWLQSKSGDVLDPTAEQYTSIGQTPPYARSKAIGFLTKQPSRRARTIIERITLIT